jgi:3-phosphoshikimate 1-carboxyvinyltransferase
VSEFGPGGPLTGSVTPPPDKSISHRAALLAAMATGTSVVSGCLDSDDTRSTLRAVEALGAEVRSQPRGDGALDLRIEGIGLDGPGRSARDRPVRIDVGNAGTLLRLLPGWLGGQSAGEWHLAGDESIARRPVDRVIAPLRAMGGDLSAHDDRTPPLEVRGASLHGIEYELPVASAQVKSCILLAGLLAEGETTVIEPEPTRDHTERMLRAAGVPIRLESAGSELAVRGRLGGRRICVKAPRSLGALELAVPGDFSSAAFFLCAALIVPGSRVTVRECGLNPTRVGLLGILNRMGARIEVEEDPPRGGEPRGTITARHSPLRGTTVAQGEVPLSIDELPLLGLLGAFAEGETVVRGAAELRHKESDRVASVVEVIRAMGGDAEAFEDGFAIRGTGGLRGGPVRSQGDHRLAMVGAIAGLASREGVEVAGMEAAAVSYPRFTEDLTALLRG